MVAQIEAYVAHTPAGVIGAGFDPPVLEAMRRTPRHAFVPENVRDRAYEDGPLPIGFGQTISQPFIVALMTDLLDVDPGDKVLEIGTGSGYQAAVLSQVAGEVYSIEIVPAARRARRARPCARSATRTSRPGSATATTAGRSTPPSTASWSPPPRATSRRRWSSSSRRAAAW